MLVFSCYFCIYSFEVVYFKTFIYALITIITVRVKYENISVLWFNIKMNWNFLFVKNVKFYFIHNLLYLSLSLSL